MKKTIAILLLIVLVISLAACGSSNTAKTDSAGYADQSAFLKDMAKGIQKRLATLDDEKHANDTDEQKAAYYKALVRCELDQIGKYEDSVFEDSKFNELAHHYIHACQMQYFGAENMKNTRIYDALWPNGGGIRSGIIMVLYEQYDLPITSNEASQYASSNSVTYINSSSSNEQGSLWDGDVILEKGDITIQSATGEIVPHSWDNKSDYKFSFVVKNNSEYDLNSISINCAILDNNENVIGTRYASAHATLKPGKTIVCSSSLSLDDYPAGKYIRIDSVMYDGNNDHSVHPVDIDEAAIIQYTLTIK